MDVLESTKRSLAALEQQKRRVQEGAEGLRERLAADRRTLKAVQARIAGQEAELEEMGQALLQLQGALAFGQGQMELLETQRAQSFTTEDTEGTERKERKAEGEGQGEQATVVKRAQAQGKGAENAGQKQPSAA